MRLRYVALALAGYALGLALVPSAKGETPTAASSPSSSSWSPPLTRELHREQRHSESTIRSRTDGGRRPGKAARWVTEAALMTLHAAGVISGGGHDDTADIGRIPPRFPRDPPRNSRFVQGYIR